MATLMKKDKITGPVNATLETSERQKRLLPYMTFYLQQDFNRPQVTYDQAGQKYQLVEQKPTTYQQYHSKYKELPVVNYQTKYVETPHPMRQQQQQIRFTPFLESNALPGSFQPMRNPEQTVSVQQVPVRQLQVIKNPNYSVIYDKLSQLKLQQQNQFSQFNNYNPQFVMPNYIRKPQPQLVSYIPVREQEVDDYKTPSKSIVQTYTAATIDIPNENQYEPVRVYDGHSVKNYQLKAPHQDHVQPLTDEEHEQYLEDQKYITDIKVHPKPRVIPQKFYQDPQKPYVTQAKPILIIQRKPVQKPYYEVEPVKYESVRFRPIKLQPVPKYQVTNNYQPINEHYDVQTVTPKYIDLVPKYVTPKHHEQGPPQNYRQPNYVTPIESYAPQYIADPTEYPQPTPTPVDYSNSYSQPTPTPVDHSNSYSQPLPDPPIEHSNSYAQPPIDNANSLSVILKKLQDSNALPHTLTPDNIDNSIRTLVKILSSLKKQDKFNRPIVVPDESGEYDEDADNEAGVGLGGTPGLAPDTVSHVYPENTPEGGTPGKPGVDYPALSTIPQTQFNCKTQRYKGFFGDPDTNCQVWHYCDLNGGQASFLCPNGTIFSQVALTCDWWYNVKCANTPQLYVLNERLYKYILPLSPKFPEDYSGPLVDRYLAMKFQEMEEKMRKERKKNKENSSDDGEDPAETTDDADELSREEQKKIASASATQSAESSSENSAETSQDRSKEN